MRDNHFPGRSVVMSTRAMVSTSQPMATQVGLGVLKAGGNAMDAAIAAGATLCVTEPMSTGIGGDCFILYHEAKTGKLHGLNGSGRAPAKATLQAMRERGHTGPKMPERGLLSVSVPGAVDAWHTATERFGTRPLGELLQPAIGYAEEGYAVSPVVGKNWKNAEALLRQTESSATAMLVDGKAPQTGTKHAQPALGRTLRQIAEQGRDVFYRGAVAEAIAAYSRANGGLLDLEDLAAHQSEWVTPISTDYRGLRLFEIPPNGQGITALMALNMLEYSDIGSIPHLSPDYIHTVAEAMKLAFAERDQWVADMQFADVPVEALLSKDFAREQWARVDPAMAAQHPMDSHLPIHKDTIYLTVVDEDRNCCSFINSLYMGFGSGVVAGDTGVMLQNRAHGFNLVEGHFNCLAPGKRPMHTIIPAMAYRGDAPVLCFGVMGGQYQAMGHTYVFSNWLDYGMDLQEAIDAPRFLPLEGQLQVERGIPEATRAELHRKGHNVVELDTPLGGGQAIAIDRESGVLSAGSEPRKDGLALGY